MRNIIAQSAWVLFGSVALPLLLAPWCFGAWEAWWFWPFAAVIMAMAGGLGLWFFALGMAPHGSHRRNLSGEPREHGCDPHASATLHRTLRIAVLTSWGVFLAYAVLRLIRAPVAMDAQRSVLLHITAVLLGLAVAFGLRNVQRVWLMRAMVANLALLGIYGIINQWITASRIVLWVPGYPQYVEESRATGTYFCPDHYAGAMEFLVCLCLGGLLARESSRLTRCLSVAGIMLGVTGVILSKSRGGGLTLLVIGLAALAWGFAQWPRTRRWMWRGGVAGGALAIIVVFVSLDVPYMHRFSRWFGRDRAQGKPWAEQVEITRRSIQSSSRWIMATAAVRAWRMSPWIGIGPGMHQHYWPRVAASPDGDRATNRWPTRLNTSNYSYEVHNDWLQLLEEYGVIGLLLFLAACATVFRAMLHGVRREERACAANRHTGHGGRYFPIVLGSLLTSIAMAFHSLGDFNLQIPANTWMFAVIVALGVTYATRAAERSPGQSTR